MEPAPPYRPACCFVIPIRAMHVCSHPYTTNRYHSAPTRNRRSQTFHASTQHLFEGLFKHGGVIMSNIQRIESPEKEACSESSSPPVSAVFSGVTKQRRESGTTSSSTSDGLETPEPISSPFIFITTNEKTGKAHADSRMLVRSHVMSSFYRKKNLLQSQAETPPRDIESAGQTSKFKLESYPKGRKTRRRKEKTGNAAQIFKKEGPDTALSVPRDLPGSGPLDPFAVAALPWDSNMQYLVQHCRSHSQLPPPRSVNNVVLHD